MQLVNSNVTPNAAHIALAKLEREWHGIETIVTQNIDNLHELGGSENLIHMHGELLKVRCATCQIVHSRQKNLSIETSCPSCSERSKLRPHVGWFGETPLEMDKIHRRLDECSLFISIGPSGNVYPAAGFVQHAISAGARAVGLNLEPSEGATLFSETRYGAATDIVPAVIDEVLVNGLLPIREKAL